MRPSLVTRRLAPIPANAGAIVETSTVAAAPCMNQPTPALRLVRVKHVPEGEIRQAAKLTSDLTEGALGRGGHLHLGQVSRRPLDGSLVESSSSPIAGAARIVPSGSFSQKVPTTARDCGNHSRSPAAVLRRKCDRASSHLCSGSVVGTGRRSPLGRPRQGGIGSGRPERSWLNAG